MVVLCLMLVLAALALALPLTVLAERVGSRAGALDGPGVSGQVKAAARRVPNTGGVAIFLSLALPMLAGLGAVWLAPGLVERAAPAIGPFLPGIREQTPLAGLLLLCLLVLHVMGVIDDRRPLGPWVKMSVMVACAVAVATLGGTRLLTLLDAHAGGLWLSVLVTVAWMVAVTNAMNFIDNMDGLSAGVAAICGAAILAAALMSGQWFVAATLALMVGACLGFLIRNFAPARIFMGDGGSLVLGFLLATLSIRVTYASIGPGLPPDAMNLARPAGPVGPPAGAWYAVLTPLVVLAVPLYDLASVVVIRLREGRSPFVGDLQHLSHRLVRRGMTRPSAVLVIYGFTTATAIGGVILPSLGPWQAVMVGAQALLVLATLAVLEFATAPYIASDPKAAGPSARDRTDGSGA